MPFVILGLVVIHVVALHVNGSNNPTGVEPKTEKDTIPFREPALMKPINTSKSKMVEQI